MDSKYILDIAELDAQHEEIEKIFIELQQAVEDKPRWHILLETLCEKLKYHFYAEESIMKVFAYPEIREHEKSHQQILKAVENYRDNTLSDLEVEKFKDHQPMQVFLEVILSQDMRFSAFLKKHKALQRVQ